MSPTLPPKNSQEPGRGFGFPQDMGGGPLSKSDQVFRASELQTVYTCAIDVSVITESHSLCATI